MKCKPPAYIMVLFCLSFSMASFAQTDTNNLIITTQNKAKTNLSSTDIKALPHINLSIKGHDEKIHNYKGVLLSTLLQKAGVQLGNAVKKQTAGSYLFIKAADGYSTVFALAEVDTLFTNKTIILADEQDGKVLPDNAKPFQIIAADEKIGARMIRQVKEIEVRNAGKTIQ